MSYFTDREFGEPPRIVEEVTSPVWRGIVVAIKTRITNGSFGFSFPYECEDGEGIAGTDPSLMKDAVISLFPITWPLDSNSVPEGFAAFDLVEFCFDHVAKADIIHYHPYYRHHHYAFDQNEGRQLSRAEINQILARNRLAFTMDENGRIVRLAPVVLREALSAAVFSTGDGALDELLETARRKFFDRDSSIRQEALEKLWDAWERLKSLENPADKRNSVKRLLDRTASEEHYRKLLEEEAMVLTTIGNTYMIRHSEVDKIPISNDAQADYFFHRLFGIIRLILHSTGREG